MTVPTPLNDHTRDDRFDRGLERLLDGDPRGIDHIEPELRDISLQMVSLANDAGWIGSDRSKSADRSRFRNARTIINAVAAVVVIGVIGSMIMLGMQIWGPGEGQYGSRGNDIVEVVLGPGVCSRLPRTDAEIASIVRKSEGDVDPFAGEGVQTDLRNATLQLTRDWNACLQTSQWTKAMSYESEHFIWSLGQELFPEGTSGLTDAEIARQLQKRHASIVPIDSPDGLNIGIYAFESSVGPDFRDGSGMVGATVWFVPMDENGDWTEWPTVVTSAWDGRQWVVVATTQDGTPDSIYKGDNSEPATPESGGST